MPQSRRLRRFVPLRDVFLRQAASRLPQSRRLRHQARTQQARDQDPPQDCRSRGDCGRIGETLAGHPAIRLKIAAVAATAANAQSGEVEYIEGTASRLPQSRRLRLSFFLLTSRTHLRLKIAAVAATAASNIIIFGRSALIRLKIAAVAATAASTSGQARPCGRAALRLPQSRRLRLAKSFHQYFRQTAASRLPQSRRLRLSGQTARQPPPSTASRLPQSRRLRPCLIYGRKYQQFPPQDCRSRGDCGLRRAKNEMRRLYRLKIAAVAATAANSWMLSPILIEPASRLPQSRRLRRRPRRSVGSSGSASRLPQSRRLRPKSLSNQLRISLPPQDCRSRGDCGAHMTNTVVAILIRLKIAAVAATAAPVGCRLLSCLDRLKIAAVAATAAPLINLFSQRNHSASRLPQSRRLRPQMKSVFS